MLAVAVDELNIELFVLVVPTASIASKFDLMLNYPIHWKIRRKEKFFIDDFYRWEYAHSFRTWLAHQMP